MKLALVFDLSLAAGIGLWQLCLFGAAEVAGDYSGVMMVIKDLGAVGLMGWLVYHHTVVTIPKLVEKHEAERDRWHAQRSEERKSDQVFFEAALAKASRCEASLLNRHEER